MSVPWQVAHAATLLALGDTRALVQERWKEDPSVQSVLKLGTEDRMVRAQKLAEVLQSLSQDLERMKVGAC